MAAMIIVTYPARMLENRISHAGVVGMTAQNKRNPCDRGTRMRDMQCIAFGSIRAKIEIYHLQWILPNLYSSRKSYAGPTFAGNLPTTTAATVPVTAVLFESDFLRFYRFRTLSENENSKSRKRGFGRRSWTLGLLSFLITKEITCFTQRKRRNWE